MSQISRQVVTTPFIVNGQPVVLRLIENPLIDDVLVAEAKIQAITISGQLTIDSSHRVSRDLRDFFIKLGVDV